MYIYTSSCAVPRLCKERLACDDWLFNVLEHSTLSLPPQKKIFKVEKEYTCVCGDFRIVVGFLDSVTNVFFTVGFLANLFKQFSLWKKK